MFNNINGNMSMINIYVTDASISSGAQIQWSDTSDEVINTWIAEEQ